jgi:hypothetical protein
LRGCVGIGVVWDASTIFTDADAEGSLFAYDIEKAGYFESHPEDRETVRRLTGEIWTNAILGVERLLQTDKGKGSSLKIAHAVFDETQSTVVRSNVLAFMRIATDNTADHKSFIFNIFAKFADEPSIVIAGIRTLSAFYKDDIGVFNWLKTFLESPNPHMRREAFKGLIASKQFMRAVSSLREYAVDSGDSLTRRAFLGRLAETAGPSYVRAATDSEVSNFLDFAQPITFRKLEEMALKTLQLHRLKARQLATSHNITSAGPVSVGEHEVRELARDYKKYLKVLAKQYKIPFVFH